MNNREGTTQRALSPQAVRVRELSKVFPADPEPVAALLDVSCDIAVGEFAVILGPSGCGKSTLIRIMSGLETPTSGTVLVNDHPVTEPLRECGMVFQTYTSFPWLSVIENIMFGLRYTCSGDKRKAREKALYYAELVDLQDFQDSYINTLSGGMRQRVALASALATEPDILFMDEPFGALDSQTRMVMQEELLTIAQTSRKTVVFVTHDIEEALLLGDRIYVCSARPARITAELDVPFPRPRTADTRNTQEFFMKKLEVFNLLREHALARILQKAYERRRR